MKLDQVLTRMRIVLPSLMAVGAFVVWLRSPVIGVAPAVLSMLIAAALGWTALFAVEGALCLCGLVAPASRASGRLMHQLARDKLTVMRAIKEVELDASLQRVMSVLPLT